MFECHLDVGHRYSHARQHQGQRDEQTRHVAVLKAQIVPEPPPACGALVPLPIFVLTTVPSVADVLFVLTLWTPQFMLLDRNLLAKGCLGRYQ